MKHIGDDIARQIRATVAANRRMIKELSLQNQALSALLPAQHRPWRVEIFNPETGKMEEVPRKGARARRGDG